MAARDVNPASGDDSSFADVGGPFSALVLETEGSGVTSGARAKHNDKEYPAMSHHDAIKTTVLDALTGPHEEGREAMLETLLEADFGDPADWQPWKREAFAEAAALALASDSGL